MTYRQAGVDIDAGETLVKEIKKDVASTMRSEVLAGVGGFASLVALPKGLKEPVLVSGTDGVGTKLKVAFATGDHNTVGIDLVAMCANDVSAVGAEPLFFLDYYACDKLEPAQAAGVIKGIAEGCKQAGCALVGGETAELPGFYAQGEYDLAGFVVGVVEKDKIVTGESVRPGDAIIGMYSSGLHSNGYSLARAIVDKQADGLETALGDSGETVGRVLLTPTKIYAKAINALRKAVEVKSLAHITGGGLRDNVPRTLPEGLGVILEAGWPVPPVFRWLAEQGPVEPMEMLRTFNMGIGMTAVVAKEALSESLSILAENGAPAMRIGEVIEVADSGDPVRFEGQV